MKHFECGTCAATLARATTACNANVDFMLKIASNNVTGEPFEQALMVQVSTQLPL